MWWLRTGPRGVLLTACCTTRSRALSHHSGQGSSVAQWLEKERRGEVGVLLSQFEVLHKYAGVVAHNINSLEFSAVRRVVEVSSKEPLSLSRLHVLAAAACAMRKGALTVTTRRALEDKRKRKGKRQGDTQLLPQGEEDVVVCLNPKFWTNVKRLPLRCAQFPDALTKALKGLEGREVASVDDIAALVTNSPPPPPPPPPPTTAEQPQQHDQPLPEHDSPSWSHSPQTLLSPIQWLRQLKMRDNQFARFVEEITTACDYEGQVSHVHFAEGAAGVPCEIPGCLHPDAHSAVTASFSQLWSHQREALEHVTSGRDVMMVTATSSGKSLVYNATALNNLAKRRTAKALFLFPTKALAQDQLLSLNRALGCLDTSLVARCLDGDTPFDERVGVVERAAVVLTNPDLLHAYLLPNHHLFPEFFENLELIVVDETHMYGGVFGSHVGCILRRLRRVCASYGVVQQLRWIGCSATVQNPKDLFLGLTGLNDCEVITRSGAPKGEKLMVLWNPVAKDRTPRGSRLRIDLDDPESPVSSQRNSSGWDGARLTVECIKRGMKVLVFCTSRAGCEQVYSIVAAQLHSQGLEQLVQLVVPYRAGYTKEERAAIEQSLFQGKLLAVICTSALEVGIDVGSLHATIHIGFPKSMSSFWQQMGRSGRGGQSSLCVLVANSTPIDQHLVTSPALLCDPSKAEAVFLNPRNPNVLRAHLVCAAKELPLGASFVDDQVFQGLRWRPVALEGGLFTRSQDGELVVDADEAARYSRFGIRGMDDSTITVYTTAWGKMRELEQVEETRALFSLFQGAIFLRRGTTYLVTAFNRTAGEAVVKRTPHHTHFTTPWINQAISVETREASYLLADGAPVLPQQGASSGVVARGVVQVTKELVGYLRMCRAHEEVIEENSLDKPVGLRYTTSAVWLDLPHAIAWQFDQAAIHGALHAVHSVVPLFARCSGADVGCECEAGEAYRLLLFDTAKGGVGISEVVYAQFRAILTEALQIVESCTHCKDGCLSCVYTVHCTAHNEGVSKQGAAALLRLLLARAAEAQSGPHFAL